MNFNKKRKRNNSDTSDEENIEKTINIITKGTHIYFYDDVDTPQILELISQIKDLESSISINSSRNQFKPVIHLHLYSYGGDAHLGLSMFDFLQNLSIDVYTYIDGLIASAATFIYLGGKKRFMSPYSYILIHQISTNFWGKFEDLKDEVENTTKMMKLCTDIYSKNTTMKKKYIEQILCRELYLNFDECKKYNFIKE
tara:strand:- start:1674 stop:2267 length:594 start_codon:yes stop_codon:yes gene_type:complete